MWCSSRSCGSKWDGEKKKKNQGWGRDIKSENYAKPVYYLHISMSVFNLILNKSFIFAQMNSATLQFVSLPAIH